MFSKAIIALAIAGSAVAELAVTEPTAKTTCRGGQECTIAWDDNNKGVSLAQQGDCEVALFTGGKTQQTFLQPIVYPTTVNVATTGAIKFVVDPTIGEDGSFYFIRFTSKDLTNPTTPTQPYLSFSAVFRLEGMTGTFNQTVLNQLQDINTSAGGEIPNTSTRNTASQSTPRSSTNTRTSSSSTSTSSNPANSDSAASNLQLASGLVAFVAGLVAYAL